MTIGGYSCIRNGNRLDYCWKESILSMVFVCDEVVVSDGGSTDGTLEDLENLSKSFPKIRIEHYPWPNPKGDINFWVDWMNWTRGKLTSKYQLQLDADEILSHTSYPEIENFKKSGARKSLWCKRYNFWKDSRHLIPSGVCLSDRVVRIGPTDIWMPSDGPHPNGAPMLEIASVSNIEIFHYGFLRSAESFFEKARQIQGFFFNSYDQRLADVETDPNWMKNIKNVEWTNRLVSFNGRHPVAAHKWLKKRGYEI